MINPNGFNGKIARENYNKSRILKNENWLKETLLEIEKESLNGNKQLIITKHIDDFSIIEYELLVNVYFFNVSKYTIDNFTNNIIFIIKW